MSSPDLLGQADEAAFRRRRTHAQVEAMTGLILQAVGYPSKRHRDFICALQSVNSGSEARVPYTPYRRAHLTLADYMQLHGSSDTRRKAVYRETVVLRRFQRRTGILLFHVTPGCEDEATTYIDYLTPAADLAMQRALSSPLWKTDKQEAKREAVAWAVEQLLPRIEIEEEDPEGGAPLPLDAYTAAQEARLCRNVENVADEIEKRGGDDDLWLERHIKELLRIKASRKKTAPARRDMASLRLVEEREATGAQQPAEPTREAEESGNKTTWDSSVRTPLEDDASDEVSDAAGVRTKTSAPSSDTPEAAPGDIALEYVRRGWPVFPLHTPAESGACSCAAGQECRSPGKHPRTRRGLKDATTDEAQVRAWWRKWPQANVGLAMGRVSGLVALDVDPRAGGDASLAELFDEHGAFPATLEALTGGGGFHFLFAHPSVSFKNSSSVLGEGLDIKTDGGYIVAAPSLHASGKRYAWRGTAAPSPIPSWLLTLLTTERPKPERTAAAVRPLSGSPPLRGLIPAGERNKQLFRIACALRGDGSTHQQIVDELAQINSAKCAPPLDEGELRRIASSAARYQPEATRRATRAQGATR